MGRLGNSGDITLCVEDNGGQREDNGATHTLAAQLGRRAGCFRGSNGAKRNASRAGGQRHGGEDGRVDGPRAEVNGVGDKCQRYLGRRAALGTLIRTDKHEWRGADNLPPVYLPYSCSISVN